ncbi:MAG: arsenate reductase ArsC [Gemmatimonadetes bacterium]|nr:arsenate reductase ArsC [Gemmatimonadota bacterium]
MSEEEAPEHPNDPGATWMDEARELRTSAPRHVLFLCVANSARSQMAEGIARALAPASIRVSSAGSEPSSVRLEAVEVLREIGIDISHHRSKGTDQVDPSVDAVITLCAEEVCPVWLGRARRVHWGLPDPAAVTGEGRLQAFRDVRDELTRRLRVVFAR